MLGEFEDKWDEAYLPISQSWRLNWPRIIPFFDSPPEIRKVIYTINVIEWVIMASVLVVDRIVFRDGVTIRCQITPSCGVTISRL